MWVVTYETAPHYYSLGWLSDSAGAVMNVDNSVTAQNEERLMEQSCVLQ